jgi:hypothetical protein
VPALQRRDIDRAGVAATVTLGRDGFLAAFEHGQRSGLEELLSFRA